MTVLQHIGDRNRHRVLGQLRRGLARARKGRRHPASQLPAPPGIERLRQRHQCKGKLVICHRRLQPVDREVHKAQIRHGVLASAGQGQHMVYRRIYPGCQGESCDRTAPVLLVPSREHRERKLPDVRRAVRAPSTTVLPDDRVYPVVQASPRRPGDRLTAALRRTADASAKAHLQRAPTRRTVSAVQLLPQRGQFFHRHARTSFFFPQVPAFVTRLACRGQLLLSFSFFTCHWAASENSVSHVPAAGQETGSYTCST